MKKERKVINTQEKLFDNKPDWYWFYGLHDAEILNANELSLQPDWGVTEPKWNCLELILDSGGARESDIHKILLYNYKTICGNIDGLKDKNVWWIGDRISCQKDSYILQLELENSHGDKFDLQIEFKTAEIFRK